MIDAALRSATIPLLVFTVAAAILAVWLAWRLRDDQGGPGRDDWEPPAAWGPDPDGLDIDWDAELSDLLNEKDPALV